MNVRFRKTGDRMEFTPRVKQILEVLLTEQDVLPVKNLADRIGVSKRTAQREMDYVSYVLKKYDLRLCSKTGAGIWLEGDEEQKEQLLSELRQQNNTEFVDKDDRRRALMLELLKDQVPKKLYYYANLFSVSEATISKDMEKIEPWFQKFHLEIFRKPGYGVALVGKERDYRIAVREFITKYMDAPVLNGLYGEADVSVSKKVGPSSIKEYYSLLNEDILRRVGICLASFPDDRIRYLTEDSYIGLMIHITIAMERVLAGDIIEANEELERQLEYDNDHELAEFIVLSLEKEFDVEIPDIEVLYICLHIKGSKQQKIAVKDKDDDLRNFVEELITIYDEQLAVELVTDEDLVNGLIAHLQPTIVRLENHMMIENPHLKDIKEEYPEIYENSKKVGEAIGSKYGFEVPEEEIGFLAIHFGAAMVRHEEKKERRRVVNVGLVCASGIGISRLMLSRLKKYLHSKVKLTAYGKDELKPIVLDRNDFFVSSMDLGQLDAEVVQVNPLLPEADLIRVEQMVDQYAASEKNQIENDSFIRQVEQINRLAGKIKDLLAEFKCIEISKDASLFELLQTAVKEITPYEENQKRLFEDIEARETIATQMIPEMEIALLHARTQGMFRVGFYLCVPDDKTAFANPDMKAVKAALIMLIPDDEFKEESSQILGFLSESLLEDDEFLDDIKSFSEYRVKESLSRLLKKYFNRYLDAV